MKHCLVHRVDKVPAGLQLRHGESLLFLLHLVLEKHPVGKFHVVRPALILPFIHPPVSEGRGKPPPVNGEVDEVDEGGHQGQGDHGDGDDGDCEGVDGCVVNIVLSPTTWLPSRHHLTHEARVARWTETKCGLLLPLLVVSSEGAPVKTGVLVPEICQLTVLAGVARGAGAGVVAGAEPAVLTGGLSAESLALPSLLTAGPRVCGRTDTDTLPGLSVSPPSTTAVGRLTFVQLALPALVQSVKAPTLRLTPDHHTGTVVVTLEAGAVGLLTASLALSVHLTVTRALESLALSTETSPGLATAAPEVSPLVGVAGVRRVVTNCLALGPADLAPLTTEPGRTETARLSGLDKMTNSMATVAGAEVSLTKLATVVRLAPTLGPASLHLTVAPMTVNTSTGPQQVGRSGALHTLCLLAIENKALRTETLPGEVVLVRGHGDAERPGTKVLTGEVLTGMSDVEIVLLVLLHYRQICHGQYFLSDLRHISSSELVHFQYFVDLESCEIEKIFKYLQFMRFAKFGFQFGHQFSIATIYLNGLNGFCFQICPVKSPCWIIH